MDRLVQPAAAVHDVERLADQRLQQLGGIGERSADPFGAHHRQAVAGQQAVRLQRHHPPQRLRPLQRVTLHLLRIPGVRRRPDEQVATAQHLLAG
jgi:hypothetical protein